MTVSITRTLLTTLWKVTPWYLKNIWQLCMYAIAFAKNYIVYKTWICFVSFKMQKEMLKLKDITSTFVKVHFHNWSNSANCNDKLCIIHLINWFIWFNWFHCLSWWKWKKWENECVYIMNHLLVCLFSWV